MLAILVLGLSIGAVAAAPSKLEKIVGGIETSITQYPYMTVLLCEIEANLYIQFCGGSIINTRSILTAAHCTEAYEKIRLRVGSSYAHSGGVVHAVASFINHPNYGKPKFDNDVSIIRTASPIVFNYATQPAVLAGTNYILPDNAAVWPVGWGHTTFQGLSSEELRHTQIWVVNQKVCSERYGAIGYGVTANMVCAGWLDMGGRSQCHGDSGGPVVHNGVVVGISAWSYECAMARYPTVNMRVSRYSTWIRDNM